MASALVNARCYLAPVVEMTEELKREMNNRHWQILRRTPFAHLMDLPPMVQERGVLDALLRMYDDRNQRFVFGDSRLVFRPEDVALVMGVPCVGTLVSFTHEKTPSEFERMYLSKTHNRHRDAINTLRSPEEEKSNKGVTQ